MFPPAPPISTRPSLNPTDYTASPRGSKTTPPPAPPPTPADAPPPHHPPPPRDPPTAPPKFPPPNQPPRPKPHIQSPPPCAQDHASGKNPAQPKTSSALRFGKSAPRSKSARRSLLPSVSARAGMSHAMSSQRSKTTTAGLPTRICSSSPRPSNAPCQRFFPKRPRRSSDSHPARPRPKSENDSDRFMAGWVGSSFATPPWIERLWHAFTSGKEVKANCRRHPARLGPSRRANTAVARKKSLRLCLSASPVEQKGSQVSRASRRPYKRHPWTWV